jgi:hypothetical protein
LVESVEIVGAFYCTTTTATRDGIAVLLYVITAPRATFPTLNLVRRASGMTSLLCSSMCLVQICQYCEVRKMKTVLLRLRYCVLLSTTIKCT